MIPWYAPTDMNIWRRRLLVPRSVVLICLLAVAGITEFRFDWIEKAVGAYLTSTNAYRPRSGAIWEKGREADSARTVLAQYADQRQNLQREVRQAVSLGQLVSNLGEDKGAMISSEHFIELYLKLPPVLSHEIVSPFTLLTHQSDGRWQRTFLERQGNGLLIYMLDANNQVIHRLSIDQILLAHIERGEVAIRTGLDQLADFNGRIYPAERFFKALDGLPAEERTRIVAHPEDLLRVEGRIERVGISERMIGDAVDLGFEVSGLDGPRVVLMQGARDEVRRIQRMLEENATTVWPWMRKEQP